MLRYISEGFPANENFFEKNPKFCEIFFCIFFFTKMNFAKEIENYTEFYEKKNYATISLKIAFLLLLISRIFALICFKIFAKRFPHFAGNPNWN